MNATKLLSIFILSILLVSVIVSGAGSSTQTTETTTDVPETAEETTTETDVAEITSEVKKMNCNDIELRRTRIKCRLKEAKMNKPNREKLYETTIPEACIGIKNPQACRAIYKASEKCYAMEGRTKDKCFKRVANFKKARLNEEDAQERKGKARNYILLLLYDLQEKVEDLVETGKVNENNAAEVIDKIVEIKQDILNEEKRDVVKPKMKRLKDLWRGIIKNAE